MSVDLNQLAAHLPAPEQQAVKKAYDKKAINSTTVFVLCFFLGWCGAHRFYLGQFGRGFARLLVPLLLVAAVVAGIALAWTASTIALIVVPLGLIALVWEILDLFRVDAEVHRRNLAVAEDLIANALLGDKSVEQAASDRLDSLLLETNATAGATTQGQPAATSANYDATTVTEISAGAETEAEQQAASQGPLDVDTTEDYALESPAGAPVAGGAAETNATDSAGALFAEEVMREHAVSAYSTTDSVETMSTASAEALPSWTEATAQTWPDRPPLEPQADAFAGYSPQAAPAGMIDLTDRASVEDAKPIADVGTVGATPLRVALPDDLPAGAQPSEGVAEGMLVLVPDNAPPAPAGDSAATQAAFAEQTAQPQPEAYVPPIVPVITIPAATAAAEALFEQERDTAPYRTVPMSQPAAIPTADAPAEPRADLAMYAAAAEGGMLGGTAAQTEYQESHSAQVEAGHHQMRRIRVVRQVKVNGEVVEETSAEEFIHAGADPEPVRQRLQEMLRQQAAGSMPPQGSGA